MAADRDDGAIVGLVRVLLEYDDAAWNSEYRMCRRWPGFQFAKR